MNLIHFDKATIDFFLYPYFAENPDEETPENPSRNTPGVENPPLEEEPDIDAPAPPGKGKPGIDTPRVPENPELENPDGY